MKTSVFAMFIPRNTRCTDVTFKTFGLQKPPRGPLKTSIATMCCQSNHKSAQSDPEECPSRGPRQPLDTQFSRKAHPRDTECARDTPEGSGGAYLSSKCIEIILNLQNGSEFMNNQKQKFGEGDHPEHTRKKHTKFNEVFCNVRQTSYM